MSSITCSAIDTLNNCSISYSYIRPDQGYAIIPFLYAIALLFITFFSVFTRVLLEWKSSQLLTLVLASLSLCLIIISYVSTHLSAESIYVWTPLTLANEIGALIHVMFCIMNDNNFWLLKRTRDTETAETVSLISYVDPLTQPIRDVPAEDTDDGTRRGVEVDMPDGPLDTTEVPAIPTNGRQEGPVEQNNPPPHNNPQFQHGPGREILPTGDLELGTWIWIDYHAFRRVFLNAPPATPAGSQGRTYNSDGPFNARETQGEGKKLFWEKTLVVVTAACCIALMGLQLVGAIFAFVHYHNQPKFPSLPFQQKYCSPAWPIGNMTFNCDGTRFPITQSNGTGVACVSVEGNQSVWLFWTSSITIALVVVEIIEFVVLFAPHSSPYNKIANWREKNKRYRAPLVTMIAGLFVWLTFAIISYQEMSSLPRGLDSGVLGVVT